MRVVYQGVLLDNNAKLSATALTPDAHVHVMISEQKTPEEVLFCPRFCADVCLSDSWHKTPLLRAFVRL